MTTGPTHYHADSTSISLHNVIPNLLLEGKPRTQSAMQARTSLCTYG